MASFSPIRPLRSDQCGLLEGEPYLVTLAQTGSVTFVTWDTQCAASGRIDVAFKGAVGQRVRFTVVSHGACDQESNYLGITLLSVTRTLATPTDYVTVGSGPLWLGRFLRVKCEFEVDLTEKIELSMAVRAHESWVMPQFIAGTGMVP